MVTVDVVPLEQCAVTVALASAVPMAAVPLSVLVAGVAAFELPPPPPHPTIAVQQRRVITLRVKFLMTLRLLRFKPVDLTNL